ncbi:MAG: protoheme IX farnesyltransferase [Candidatus Omnitrophica bacterium]|nr:protoheme IX farnesyltransferase [Candidatus Omnitrophota bacterium]
MSVSSTPSLSVARNRFWDYLELTKPRPISLVLLSVLVGFLMGTPGGINGTLLFFTLLGTAMVASGSMALNQWMERREDALMLRTANRPLPAGRLNPWEAFIFGSLLGAVGVALLAVTVNQESAILAAMTFGIYLILYTPLKKVTSLCTIIGAVPGALPPLIGWSAASGSSSLPAWILFLIIFLWQMPHFMAIAWLYREDYARGGFAMLSVEDPTGIELGKQVILYSLILLPVSLLPTFFRLTGSLYFFSALILGGIFLGTGIYSLKQMDKKAGILFRVSVLYLFLLLIFMVADKV